MYKKGARAERELVERLWELGYAVIRSAGSGKSGVNPPDVVAIREGVILGFECKYVDKDVLWISGEQGRGIEEWEKRSGFPVFIAWKRRGRGWTFFRLGDMRKTEAGYVITWEEAGEKGRGLLGKPKL